MVILKFAKNECDLAYAKINLDTNTVVLAKITKLFLSATLFGLKLACFNWLSRHLSHGLQCK